ncbi:alpha/beta hydrolase [Actinospica robiniae]|uniref:alpha/beta hydrolase n=1 Tax=Actinospica robiniae TaxID=304901 RepID=UPI000424D1F1|nr:alpha/beta hydrolase [Actinospica robiniae]
MTTQITYSLLRAAQAEAYADAADAMKTVVDGFEQSAVDLNHQIYQRLEDSWSGPAATAALSTIGTAVGDYQATLDYLGRFVGLLRSAYEGIADAQAYLNAAAGIAARNDWQIDDFGQTYPTLTPAPHNQAIVQQLYEEMNNSPDYAEMQDLIRRALSTAQAVNDQVASAMDDTEQYGQGKNWQTDAASSQASASAMEAKLEKSLIPTGADSSETAAWWSAFGKNGAAAQVQLIKDQPAAIGALNGLPATVRDKANRILLTGDINHDTQLQSTLTAQQKQVEAEINQLYASGKAVNPLAPNVPSLQLKALTDQLNSIETRLASVNGQLPALQMLQQNINMSGQPYSFEGRQVTMPPMYLLGFDTNDAGHAIVACGDPDTAKNVCVYVPGLNTSSNNTHFQYDIQHTQNMTLAADKDSGANDTATIIWLGYNAPQFDVASANFSPDVVSTDDATAAVANLTSFINSLRVTNPHINNYTLLGHSYGSLVVGETAKASHLPVDNIVLVGSPGTSANSADQLNIDPSHVWAGTASDDPVARLQWFGPAPTSAGFGANQFTVNATGGGFPMGQHGEYFDVTGNNANNDYGDSSLTNIGYIISGHTDKVQLVHSAGPIWQPPQSIPSPSTQVPSTPSHQTPSPQP